MSIWTTKDIELLFDRLEQQLHELEIARTETLKHEEFCRLLREEAKEHQYHAEELSAQSKSSFDELREGILGTTKDVAEIRDELRSYMQENAREISVIQQKIGLLSQSISGPLDNDQVMVVKEGQGAVEEKNEKQLAQICSGVEQACIREAIDRLSEALEQLKLRVDELQNDIAKRNKPRARTR